MTENALRGRRVLIVEDEYMVAEDLRNALEAAGADILGPVPSVGEAIALIDAEARIDFAVLDINLGGELVFPAADALDERGVPFVFTTGYENWAMPERFAQMPRFEKPVEPVDLVRTISSKIEA